MARRPPPTYEARPTSPSSAEPRTPPPGSDRAAAFGEFEQLLRQGRFRWGNQPLSRAQQRHMVLRMLSLPGPRRELELLHLRFVPEAKWAEALHFIRHTGPGSLRAYIKEGQAEAHTQGRIAESRLTKKLDLGLGYCSYCGAADWLSCPCPEMERFRAPTLAACATAKKQVLCNCARTDCEYTTAPHPLEVDDTITAPPLAPPSPEEEDPREELLQDFDRPSVPANVEVDLQHDLLCGLTRRTEWKTRAPSPVPLPPASPCDSPPPAAPRPEKRKRARSDDVCFRCGKVGHWAEDCVETPCTGKCLRCGEAGHWAKDCTAMRCGNCHKLGHYAESCPEPAPCFLCGELGHWAKACPRNCTPKRENQERRWVFHGPPPQCAPRVPLEQHHCSGYGRWRGQSCCFTTTTLKPHGLMPAHKWRVDGAAPHEMSR